MSPNNESQTKNEFGQPVGPALPGWQGAAYPQHVPLHGRFCRLEALSQAHADALWAALQAAGPEHYTYLDLPGPTWRSDRLPTGHTSSPRSWR